LEQMALGWLGTERTFMNISAIVNEFALLRCIRGRWGELIVSTLIGAGGGFFHLICFLKDLRNYPEGGGRLFSTRFASGELLPETQGGTMKVMMIRKFAMRAGVVAMLGAALTAMPMMAQQGGGGGRMTPEARVAAIDKAVTLTDDQKSKITALLTADATKMQALRDAQDPDMRTKMMAMRTDENTQIKAMLTDDQKPKYDAYVASMPRRGGGGGGAPAQQ
jgi:protein CpxP